MRFDVHHHIELSPEVRGRFDALSRKLDRILMNQEFEMATIAEVTAAVARNTDAEDAALTYLKDISQKLKDALAANDPAALDALVAQIDANTAKAAAAIVSGTPAA
jgi:DNA-binding SARP family transcriptional activator